LFWSVGFTKGVPCVPERGNGGQPDIEMVLADTTLPRCLTSTISSSLMYSRASSRDMMRGSSSPTCRAKDQGAGMCEVTA
jgi:hypothetical protein